MAVKNAHRAANRQFRKESQKNKTEKPLTHRQFLILLEKFYEFAERHGFYRSVSKAISENGFHIFSFQREIGESILESVFMQKSMDINISVMRQVGKTEFVSLTTAFIFDNFYKIFRRAIEIAVIAPEKDTAGVMFKRITKYINLERLMDGGDTKKYKQSFTDDTIQLFGIYDEYKGSTIEGRSFDMVIRDEAHLGNDKKFADEVEPTMLAKNGPLISIGNGGFKDCLFRGQILQGNIKDDVLDLEVRLIRYTWTEIKPYFKQLADKGLKSCKTRNSNIEKYIKKHGGDEGMMVLKNIYCKWMTEYGNAVTEAQIVRCRDKTIEWDGKSELYMGLDFAVVYDRTVATIMDDKKRVIDWIIVKDAREMKKAREQCEFLREVCDERGYTPKIYAIGFDATGVGSGGVSEFLEMEFQADLVPYMFSDKSKHEWYIKAIESIATEYEEDRMKYDPQHRYAKLFEKEWTTLERKHLEKKKYLSFNAPNREGHFDDFCASYAICHDLRSRALSEYVWEEEPEKAYTNSSETTAQYLARYSSMTS